MTFVCFYFISKSWSANVRKKRSLKIFQLHNGLLHYCSGENKAQFSGVQQLFGRFCSPATVINYNSGRVVIVEVEISRLWLLLYQQNRMTVKNHSSPVCLSLWLSICPLHIGQQVTCDVLGILLCTFWS